MATEIWDKAIDLATPLGTFIIVVVAVALILILLIALICVCVSIYRSFNVLYYRPFNTFLRLSFDTRNAGTILVTLINLTFRCRTGVKLQKRNSFIPFIF